MLNNTKIENQRQLFVAVEKAKNRGTATSIKSNIAEVSRQKLEISHQYFGEISKNRGNIAAKLAII